MRRHLALFLAALILVAPPLPLPALVAPGLQPIHLVATYRHLALLEIEQVDRVAGVITCRVERSLRGELGASVRLAFDDSIDQPFDEHADLAFGDIVAPGMRLVAFVGGHNRATRSRVLAYVGDGMWIWARIDGADNEWRWESQAEEILSGTFNGAIERLVQLLDEQLAQTAWFPAEPVTRFADQALRIDTREHAHRGVALQDLDGDGDLDVYACNLGGDRAYLQEEGMRFVERSAALGLAGLTSPSVSLADIDGDGRQDLLAGGRWFLGTADGFRSGGDLALGANLKCAAFVELDGDGRPDILASVVGGGLRAFRNADGAFVDTTAAVGLDSESAGAGGDGFFAPADWNGDGRIDLYYGSGGGLLLVQDATGRFQPQAHPGRFAYSSGPEMRPGLTGATTVAGLWTSGGEDLLAPTDDGFVGLARQEAGWLGFVRYSNELRVAGARQLATLHQDLNCDGRPDAYTLSWSADSANGYHTNRGYGSWMRDELYGGAWFPPEHRTGAWGIAAGDVDGDGAVDLLLGGVDGHLSLFVNACLDHLPEGHLGYHERKRAEARIVSVEVRGDRGVLGATLRLLNQGGTCVAWHRFGGEVLTGCRGPDRMPLVAREPGVYRLDLRYADGHRVATSVDLDAPAARTAVVLDRDGARE